MYAWIDFPGLDKEREIIALKVPELAPRLQEQAARFVHALRKLDLRKAPSVAETLDWARALVALRITELDVPAIRQTLNLVLKHEEDLKKAHARAASLLASHSGSA